MEVIASRIAGFLKQNPGIQLHLNNIDIDSIAQDTEDAQIKYCLHPPAGMYNIELLKEKLVPVCSPLLLANVANPEDLLVDPGIPRLHYRDVKDWKRWISHHGFDDLTANSNLFLTTNTHCWRLLVPTGHRFFSSTSGQKRRGARKPVYCVRALFRARGILQVYMLPRKHCHQPGAAAFRDWLVNEVSTIC